MEKFIFIPESLNIDASRLIKSAGEDYAGEINDMLGEAAAAAAPKAIYAVAPLRIEGDAVEINGVSITSALMAENFRPVSRVFPYVITCGAELEQWSKPYAEDPLAGYWAEEIKKLYLGLVGREFRKTVIKRYGITAHFSSMNPGSLKEWPITGQRELFAILGRDEVQSRAGVVLTDSMLMLPSKSGSGISFESESNYQNCLLCPLEGCPNRRAKYKGAGN